MESDTRWNDSALLDDLFMRLAEGDASVVPELHDLLKSAPARRMSSWPEEARDIWETGLELGLEGLASSDLGSSQEFLLDLAAAGYDSLVLRDHLAAAARTTFADYLDPAGLLSALGVHTPEVPAADIAQRWHVFEVLAPGRRCFEDQQGLGTVEAVDDIANHVRIQYDRVLDLPLEMTVARTVVVKPESPVEAILERGEAALKDLADARMPQALLNSVVSAGPVTKDTLRRMLTPEPLSPQVFSDLLGTPAPEQRKETPRTAGRRWDEARSLTELVGLLKDLKTITELPEALDNVVQILHGAAPREDAVTELAEAVARLHALAAPADWLDTVLQDLGNDVLAWNDEDTFAEVTDELSGRLVPHWLAATADAKNRQHLAEMTLLLPLRLWSHAERVISGGDDADERLLHTVVEAVKGGNVSADALLWLYRRGDEPATLLANPPLLFKTLEKPVRGSYIKASKDLHKLLMDDQDFQRLVMQQGAPDAVASLVRMVRHASLLDSGERQSLLVKIVRVFPEAKDMVEQRRKKLSTKAVGKITSLRTFHVRRRELEHIINVDIPANSRAIGHARSYGDLRENAEFKAAKERQAYLGARRAELEEQLHEIMPTDFHDVNPGEVVIPGCTVTVDSEDGERTAYHIMGIWDSVPERHIVSYQTPVGKALMGRRVGGTVTMPAGHEATIVSVEPLSDDLLAWVANTEAEA